jgi:predicted nucleic-acid-binding Zn-ribbon protein
MGYNPEDEYDIERDVYFPDLWCRKCDHNEGERELFATGTQWGYGAEWLCSKCGARNMEEGEWSW